jgi:hypothetical protein
MGQFVLGGLAAAVGVGALYGASLAKEGPLYVAGLLLFAGAVLYVFNLVRRNVDGGHAG